VGVEVGTTAKLGGDAGVSCEDDSEDSSTESEVAGPHRSGEEQEHRRPFFQKNGSPETNFNVVAWAVMKKKTLWHKLKSGLLCLNVRLSKT
jgi:hypothetical protein